MSYFSSRGANKSSSRRPPVSLEELKLDLGEEDARSQLRKLPDKNAEAKEALYAKYVRDFPEWLLPLRLSDLLPRLSVWLSSADIL